MNLRLGFRKIIIINVIVLCGLFLALEFSYRVWLYFSNCDTICHNSAFLTKLDTFNRSFTHIYGFLAPDPITGYSPADGTFVIREPGWNDATITIRQGVRVNPNFVPTSADDAILAVGDSYVFGDQVSDDEAWPSILERRLNRHVVNGGVSGYGTVQAVLHAEQLLKAGRYSLVILSILANNDLGRDRLVNNYDHFYRPVVIREGGRLRLTSVEESRRVAYENFICAHSWIPELFFWSHIAKQFFLPLGYDGRCVAVQHPKAKGVTDHEILEFAVERLATFPVKTTILVQYPRSSFQSTNEAARAEDEARMIRDVANRHRVPVIDTYQALKREPLREIYIYSEWWPHHSKKGNEVVADLIAREIRGAPVSQ
jgi:hypothetical protein